MYAIVGSILLTCVPILMNGLHQRQLHAPSSSRGTTFNPASVVASMLSETAQSHEVHFMLAPSLCEHAQALTTQFYKYSLIAQIRFEFNKSSDGRCALTNKTIDLGLYIYTSSKCASTLAAHQSTNSWILFKNVRICPGHCSWITLHFQLSEKQCIHSLPHFSKVGVAC